MLTLTILLGVVFYTLISIVASIVTVGVVKAMLKADGDDERLAKVGRGDYVIWTIGNFNSAMILVLVSILYYFTSVRGRSTSTRRIVKNRASVPS